MDLVVRPAEIADIPQILAFIRELAEYEREPAAAIATAEDLLRDGFSKPRRFECLMAEWAGEPAGFALYFYNYSTWRGRAGVYLEDLFVRPAMRGKGIGKALLTRVAAVAVAGKCARLEWSVLDWNMPAIDFYERMGAVAMTDWTIMRVSGDSLARLAELAAADSPRGGG